MTLRSWLLTAILLIPAQHAWATCYRVTSVGAANTTANAAIRPGEGTAGAWAGAWAAACVAAAATTIANTARCLFTGSTPCSGKPRPDVA